MSEPAHGDARPAPPPGTDPDVAVVGAGWAGLAAAVALTRAGRRVTVFDTAPVPGGRAREVALPLAGTTLRLDNGQHLLVGAYRETLRLAAELIAPDPLPIVRRPMALVATDGLSMIPPRWPAPLHLAAGLLGARGLDWRARFAMVRLMSGLRAARWQVRPGETVAALLERLRQPAGLCLRLWEPLCVATLNTPPAQACAQTFATVLRDTLGADAAASDFVLPAGTLGELLPAPAERWLRARGATLCWRTPVQSIRRDGDGWQLATSRGPVRAPAVIVAVPPVNAERVLHGALPTADLAPLTAFTYEPIATAWLAWPADRAPTLPPWIMLTEEPARRGYGQWLFDRGRQGDLRIAAVVVSARGREMADTQAGGDALAAAMGEQVARQLEIEPPRGARIVTERRATFGCTPDRPRLTPDHFTARAPGLWIAGDHAWPSYPATLEAAVRSGLAAAAGCLACPLDGSGAGSQRSQA